MNWAFFTLAGVTLISAIAAMSLRNPVHCALSLTLTFAGLAGLYLHLNAQFVGLVQVLVYIGAVAVLIVFAILLTQSADVTRHTFSGSWWVGLIVAAGVFCALTAAILSSSVTQIQAVERPVVTVRDIGSRLLGEYVLPLEVIGLLLTAALIGGVLIAVEEKPSPEKP